MSHFWNHLLRLEIEAFEKYKLNVNCRLIHKNKHLKLIGFLMNDLINKWGWFKPFIKEN
jgi:hypothetical protein